MCSTFQYEKTLLAAILGGEPFLNLLHTFRTCFILLVLCWQPCVFSYDHVSLNILCFPLAQALSEAEAMTMVNGL